jgi:hypothetical protein
MKFRSLFLSLCAMAALTFPSCDKDDTTSAETESVGQGTVSLAFDNMYGANALSVVQEYTTSLHETLTINNLKYIVSNVTFIKSDGTTYVYPKSQSYFIINQLKRNSRTLSLSGIPAGDYAKVKFGLGVDREQFSMGASGQGDFLAAAQAEQMLWSWSAGYRFLAYEGTYASETVTDPLPFEIHTGQTGTDYNYAEVTLTLPSALKVQKDGASQIHIKADISKIIDGAAKINLTEIDEQGTGATIIGGNLLPVVTANFSGAFSADAVTNN